MTRLNTDLENDLNTLRRGVTDQFIHMAPHVSSTMNASDLN